MSEKFIYYGLLVIGTLCVLAAGIFDRQMSEKKQISRDDKASKDRADLIKVVVAAEGVRSEYQKRSGLQESASSPARPSASTSFISVDENLKNALDNLPADTAEELNRVRKQLQAESRWLAIVEEWNKKLLPVVEASMGQIQYAIGKAEKDGLVTLKTSKVNAAVTKVMRSDLDKSSTTTLLMNVEFEPNISWEVTLERGYVGYQGGVDPTALQGPHLRISWALVGGGGGGTDFQFSLPDGNVNVVLSEKLYPIMADLRKQFKGPELVGNVTVAMLQRVHLQGLNPRK